MLEQAAVNGSIANSVVPEPQAAALLLALAAGSMALLRRKRRA
jgi:hypothetical protein